MVSFRYQDRGRVVAGEITVTFRLWKSGKVKAGKAYSTSIGTLQVESVDVLPAGLISKRDVRPSGCESITAIWELAGEHTNTVVTPETLLYRVQFCYLGEADHAQRTPPTTDLAQLAARLEKMDRLSRRGPWTLAMLRLIASAPQVPARRLAAELGWETLDFKAHVRRLKALGLTISHDVGYELSDLGRSYVDSLDDRRRRHRRPVRKPIGEN